MLRNWFRKKKMMNCRAVVDLLSDYMAGDLSAEDVAGIRKHLKGCPNCEAFFDSLQTTVSLTKKLDPEEIPPAVTERLQAFLKERTGKPGQV